MVVGWCSGEEKKRDLWDVEDKKVDKRRYCICRWRERGSWRLMVVNEEEGIVEKEEEEE